MLDVDVEILALKPCEQKVVIVPLFEQSIEAPGDTVAKPPTLAQALYLYATGEDGHLITVLEGNEHACDFIMRFEETWFVHTQPTSGIGGTQLRELGVAVHLARAVQGKRMALRALKEC